MLKRLASLLLSLLLCLLLAAGLTACGEDQSAPEREEGVLIYAALNPLDSTRKRNINIFNRDHADVQIEVLDYSYEGGVERLLTELALGKVPDIMELHRLGKGGAYAPPLR